MSLITEPDFGLRIQPKWGLYEDLLKAIQKIGKKNRLSGEFQREFVEGHIPIGKGQAHIGSKLSLGGLFYPAPCDRDAQKLLVGD